ncbi:putative G-protein coupled receptor 33 [Varanus komodoensis]|uniref:probable G-protein coupled receptor 33 n=1 Tax=Varanus komodoensis TaxID=61221 RepID=UPI001CF76F5E|nr:probable G-protein coupled receptor 33 [Varanus komodoensis]KAF7236515.1 putative G-protein coupled receptor 33 [Varanus komodoensis]
MDKGNTTFSLGNSSTTGTNANTSHYPVAITPWDVTIACCISVSFLVGITMNGLLLWVLGVKMKRTVNTLWFSHLIITYLMSTSFMPFLVPHILLDSHWIFGTVMCKILNFLGSLGMFTSVFLLTIISLDRYLLICYPIWSQHNRTLSQAKKLIGGVWLVSLTLSAPNLSFRETREMEKGKTACVNNYALSSDWDGATTQALRYRIHLALFVVRFLLAFLLPFITIVGCCSWMGREMKKKKLVRNRKPFRVLVAAVASFFVCWSPYHLYNASLLLGASRVTVKTLRGIFVMGICLNICFTPVLYLFVGEKFQKIFKISILLLLQKSFMDDPMMYISHAHHAGPQLE